MAVDPVIQKLMDLIEPPDDGDQASPTSEFGAGRTTGSNPHGGFDMNRGRGVQPHGRVTSPVYGSIKESNLSLDASSSRSGMIRFLRNRPGMMLRYFIRGRGP